jgi:tetratricopeptide (TPR) repeat protein
LPRFLLAVLTSLAYVLVFAYSGTLARPFAYRHAWFPKKWRPGPYTGQRSQPLKETPELLKKCQELCEGTGQQVSRQVQDGQEAKIVTPGPYTRCPATGLNYALYNFGNFVVVCPLHAHKQPVFWDSRYNQVLSEWRTPSTLDDDGRLQDYWLHAQTAYAGGDYTTSLGECQKIKAMDKPEGDGLALACYLALGQADQGLKLCDENLKKDAANNDWLQSRYNCLLDLGRAQEVLDGKPAAVEKCMAELEADKNEEAAKTLQGLSNDPLFKAYGLMALQRYDEARQECARVLTEQGWQADFTGNAVVVGVLCDWLKGGSEEDARSFLSQALQEAPKTWPYPLLRYLNRDLCEEELLALAGSDRSHRVEAGFTIGLDLLAQHSDMDHARALLREIEPYGHFFESMTAHSLLKSLK